MTTTTQTETLSPARKAALTKGATGHKAAALRARIAYLDRIRSGLTGYDKGLTTKAINAKRAELASLGFAD